MMKPIGQLGKSAKLQTTCISFQLGKANRPMKWITHLMHKGSHPGEQKQPNNLKLTRPWILANRTATCWMGWTVSANVKSKGSTWSRPMRYAAGRPRFSLFEDVLATISMPAFTRPQNVNLMLLGYGHQRNGGKGPWRPSSSVRDS